MPIKTVCCCICGAEVTKRQSLYFGDGKRCCRSHQEELQAKEEKSQKMMQSAKDNFIAGLISELEGSLYRHSEKSIQNFFSMKFNEFCKANADFSKFIKTSELKAIFEEKFNALCQDRIEALKKDYGKTRFFISRIATDVHRAWFICLYKLSEERRIPDEVEAREFLKSYFERHEKLNVLVARDAELEEKLIAQLDAMGKPLPSSYVIGRR